MVARGGERGFSTEAEVVAPLSFRRPSPKSLGFSQMSEQTPEAQRATGAGTILARPVDRRGWFLLWGCLSALLMAVGSMGPWLRVGRSAAVYGIRQGDIWLVLLAAVVGGALFVVLRQRRTAGVAALLAGLVGLGITLYDRWHLVRLVPLRSLRPGIHYFSSGFLQVGWGLDLALLASLSFAVCGLVWLLTLADLPRPGFGIPER